MRELENASLLAITEELVQEKVKQVSVARVSMLDHAYADSDTFTLFTG